MWNAENVRTSFSHLSSIPHVFHFQIWGLPKEGYDLWERDSHAWLNNHQPLSLPPLLSSSNNGRLPGLLCIARGGPFELSIALSYPSPLFVLSNFAHYWLWILLLFDNFKSTWLMPLPLHQRNYFIFLKKMTPKHLTNIHVDY